MPKIFKNKQKFNAREHFRHAFGVMNATQKSPEKICLRCSREQGEYIASYPIHHTQKVVQETRDFIDFEYLLYPTYDFVQEVLSFGRNAQIISPVNLRQDIICNLKESLQNYSGIC